MTAGQDERVRDLLDEARSTPYSAAKVRLTEEAVDLADLAGDEQLAFDARMQLVDAATFSGAPEKALVAFAWCLSFEDRREDSESGDAPDWMARHDLLWNYKWIAGQLPSYAGVPRPKIEEMLADMTRRYLRRDRNLRPVHAVRWKVAVHLGDDDVRDEQYGLWKRTERDIGADCPACELDDRVLYNALVQRAVRAVELARPILDGRQSCHCVPQGTFTTILMPLVRMGRRRKAAELHRWGYRLSESSRHDVIYMHAHLEFLAVTRNLERGREILAKSTRFMLESFDEDSRFHYFLAARLLLRVMAKEGTTEVLVPTPSEFPLHRRDARHPIEEILEWADEEIRTHEAAFNARNGNRRFTEHIEESRKLEDLVAPFPLD